ncbi:DNA adenine methylase [Vibrio fluvialis]|uniref:DNA adenine methylase n=1 Tax=Vibrio fluvialis TaxID=676 RepID=UPI0012AD989F|nr:DNA adenine methylase [Vibrio fluvialis]
MLIKEKESKLNGHLNQRPLTMQYLGGKSRIVTNILSAINESFPEQKKFVDLFSGSGVVAFEAQRKGYEVIANDIQPYSATLLSSLLNANCGSLSAVIDELSQVTNKLIFSGCREKYLSDYFKEQSFLNQIGQDKFDWKVYKEFVDNTKLCNGTSGEVAALKESEKWTLFLAFYRNTYFGVYQCAEIDFLREFSESLPQEEKKHLLASVISAMTHCGSSTTHLAQFLKPNGHKSTINLIKKRSVSIIQETLKRLVSLESTSLESNARVLQQDFKSALNEVMLDSDTIVYADPPYFKEHYSRYYHVLDTFVLYDYPLLTFNKRIGTTTVGRYREDRITSDFGKKALAKGAFEKLIDDCMNSNAKLAISYACSSIVDKEFFLQQAKERNLKVEVKEFSLKHTGQGQARHKDVTEYLFLISR